MYTPLYWTSCYTDQVDAVPITVSIRQVVAQMRAINRHSFSRSLQYAHIIPHNLLIAEGWPAMHFALSNKLIHRPTNGRLKQCLPSVGIVERDRSIRSSYG